jgi:Protein of unknown function (DUF3631)
VCPLGEDFAESFIDYDPDMGGLIHRPADNWRPLFAIADVIGSDWPERARDAAAVLSPRDVESIGPMLLADIKAAFDEQAVDRLSSADICVALNNMEGKPWGDWKGKELTPNQLARLLKPFRIKSDNIRIGSKVPKGYYRRQFEEAWQRYLDPEGVPEPQQRYNPDEMGTSCTFQNATAETHVALQKCEKPAPNGHCSVVTFPKGGNQGHGAICAQCGGNGDVHETWYGDRSALLHPACQDAWRSTQDGDDLDIPPELDRRAELVP